MRLAKSSKPQRKSRAPQPRPSPRRRPQHRGAFATHVLPAPASAGRAAQKVCWVASHPIASRRKHHMRRVIPLFCAWVALVAAACAAHAVPMNKCVVEGSVSYQQAPCPSTQARRDPTIEELNAAAKRRRAEAAPTTVSTPPDALSLPRAVTSAFACDGRKHCSQMRSCPEAKYFLANCPDVKMDGDNDGVPCEEHLCGH